VTLGDAPAPEGLAPALGQDAPAQQPGHGKQTRIPPGADQGGGVPPESRFVYGGKMPGDVGVGIKAVYHIEPLGILRCLLWQVSSTSAAKNHNINLVFHLLSIIYRIYLRCFSQDLNRFRSTTGKYTHQFHIRIVLDRTFYATSQVAISQDTNTNTHYLIPPILPHARCTIPTNGQAAPIPYERQMLHVCGIYIYFTL